MPAKRAPPPPLLPAGRPRLREPSELATGFSTSSLSNGTSLRLRVYTVPPAGLLSRLNAESKSAVGFPNFESYSGDPGNILPSNSMPLCASAAPERPLYGRLVARDFGLAGAILFFK